MGMIRGGVQRLLAVIDGSRVAGSTLSCNRLIVDAHMQCLPAAVVLAGDYRSRPENEVGCLSVAGVIRL